MVTPPGSTPTTQCRCCRSEDLTPVLDLGAQPACDYFPPLSTPLPDPKWPLGLLVCRACALAQLSHRSPAPQEPRALESATMRTHAQQASARLIDRLALAPGTSVLEFISPHGGSWAQNLRASGLTVDIADPVALPDALLDTARASTDAQPAAARACAGYAPTGDKTVDVVLDNMAIIHAEDLTGALRARLGHLRPGGRLVIEFHHALAAVREGQFDAIRHGHPVYLSLLAWQAALRHHGLDIETAWAEDIFGGSVIAVARAGVSPDAAAARLLAAERAAGLDKPAGYAPLAQAAVTAAHEFAQLVDSAPTPLLGYGASSRAVTYAHAVGLDAQALPAIADRSPQKHGRRLPGTQIAIICPNELIARSPASVLVLTWDIATEVVADLRAGGLTHARYLVATPSAAQVP